MTVTYDYYRIFYYLAKYRSFTRAAGVLENSQPNITRAINNLEHELGCRLFLRSNKGVVLTPEGERLYEHVRVAQEHLMAGEAELNSCKNLENGRILIGTSETALHGLLLYVLRDFHHAYPKIHIRVTNQSTPQALQAVKNGAVDLAVITAPVGVFKPLTVYPLRSFQDILIAGPGFYNRFEEGISLSELQEYPLVSLGEDTLTYEVYDNFFAQNGLTMNPDIEVATTDQILPMVKNDLGVGFLPDFFAREALAAGEVVRLHLKEPIPERQICLVKDSKRTMSAAAQMLERMIRNWDLYNEGAGKE